MNTKREKVSQSMNAILLKNSNGIKGYSKKRYKLGEATRLIMVVLSACLIIFLITHF